MTTPNTATAARTYAANSAHWYNLAGEPMYELPKKDGKGMKKTTLADARVLNLCPSVTTIIDSILRKPALEAWKIEQAVLACMTAPRKDKEELDAFIKRILQEEQQQNAEAKTAADRGTQIHDAMEKYFTGQEVPEALQPWVMPAIDAINTYGMVVATEKILVGDGYAGKTDLILEAPDCFWIDDYKSTKKLPDPLKGGAWTEHRLQLSAYAAAFADTELGRSKPIKTKNIYISTVEEGKFCVCEHDEWQTVYAEGFAPLVTHWQWSNAYRPKQARARTPVDIETAPETADEAQPANKPNDPPPPASAKGKTVVWSPGIPTSPKP